MRIMILRVALGLFAMLTITATPGCKEQRHKSTANVVAQDTIETGDGLGEMTTVDFASRDSSSVSVAYQLSVTHRIHSGDGTFRLLAIDRANGKRTEYAGKRYTQRGIPADNDATVWQLLPDKDGAPIFNFLYKSDTNQLVLLNDKCEPTDTILSPAN